MAVVRAGDAQPTSFTGDAQLPTSRRYQTSLENSARVESYRRIADDSFDSTGDRITPLSIPPPPALPIDLVPKDPPHQPSLDGVTSTVHVTSSESETRSRIATAAISRSSPPDLRPSPVAKVATQGPTPSARPKYSPITVILAGVVVAGVVVAVVPRRGQNASPAITQVQAPSGPKLQQPSSLVTDNAQPLGAEANKNAVATEPAAAESAPVASAPPGTTHVTLDLTPVDAKVNIRGREVAGPPYEFDIANGERIAVEVKRPGFATAKVVIDGKKPLVHFGMLREHWPKPK